MGEPLLSTINSRLEGLAENGAGDLEQFLERQPVFRLSGVSRVTEPDFRSDRHQPVITFAVLFHLRLTLKVDHPFPYELV